MRTRERVSNAQEDRAIEVAKAMSSYLNHGGMHQAEAECLAEHLMNDHRTLVQGFGRVLFECLAIAAEDYRTGHHDARNEAFCRAADLIKKDYEARKGDGSFPPALPFI